MLSAGSPNVSLYSCPQIFKGIVDGLKKVKSPILKDGSSPTPLHLTKLAKLKYKTVPVIKNRPSVGKC